MKKWKIIKTLNDDNKPVCVYMWPGDPELHFCIEDLEPQDFVDSDTWEFSISLNGLESILKEARQINQPWEKK